MLYIYSHLCREVRESEAVEWTKIDILTVNITWLIFGINKLLSFGMSEFLLFSYMELDFLEVVGLESN